LNHEENVIKLDSFRSYVFIEMESSKTGRLCRSHVLRNSRQS
jgi:hypothetical protein